jgi:hypothetical protein
VRTIAPGDPVGDGAVVALGEAPLPEGAGPAVRWSWRRAPWPVADWLFGLPPPEGGAALVVASDPERRELFRGLLERLGAPARAAERLTVDDLRAAAVVLLPGEDGEPLPAHAMAVLAARRVLVTGRCEPAFGLIPEVDWFPAAHHDDLVQYADSVLRYPDAFATPRALGALAAERHRASVVYRRLLVDLALEGAWPSAEG